MALTRYPAFGADQPGMVEIARETTLATAPGSLAFLRTIDNPGGLESIHRLMLEDESLRQSLNPLAMIPGFEDAGNYFVLPEGTTINLKFYLHGIAPVIPAAKTVYSNAASFTVGVGCPSIWGVYGVLGGLSSMDALDATVAGSSAQELLVADTSDLDIGGMVTVDVSATATPAYESGWIRHFIDASVGSDDGVELRVDLSAAPGAAKAVYGSVVAYVASYLTDSFTIRWTGHKSGATTPLRCTLVGCVPSAATIEIPAYGLPTIELTLMVTAAMWDDTSATGVTPQTWVYPAPEQAIGHRVQFVPGMVHDAAEDLNATSLTINIDNGLQQVPALGAKYGPFTYVKTAQTITVEMHAPYTAALRQAYSAQSSVGIEVEVGSQPGKRIGIAMPGLAIESFSGPVSDNGVAYCDATFRATSYLGDEGAGTDADKVDKTFAIAWG